MARAVEMVVGKEFVSEYDTDKKKTTWLLRTLTGGEYMRCTRQGYVDDALIVEFGLTGWNDWIDDDNKPIEFSVAQIARIPPLIFQDISFAIQSLSTVSDEERKNSKSQSK